MKVKLLLLCVAYSFAATAVTAEPLPPPKVETAYSRNFKFAARSDPQTNQTVVFRQDRPDHPLETLWTFPRWFRVFEVSDDGNAIVAATDEMNSLPLNVPETYVLLTFIVKAKIVREITLQQLFGSRSKLKSTPTSLVWGEGLRAIDENGYAIVDTVVGYFIFEAQTGKCVFPPNNHVN